ncbi:MAG: S-layer homology domain-containing protein, partial [Acidimicrobiales bacterium]|nr:S-layer homology domain-containing protein [Acidimicrobiales bacterium]
MAFASNTFTDVDEGRYYTDAVGWAADNGVTTGTSATTFSPENAVTRAQNVTFAYRYDQNVVQPALDNIDNRFDGLDTLDELSCTATQVVINDSGWRCADPVLKPSFRAAINRTLETTDTVGYFTSVAVGADGNPVISHWDATNFDLELYVCADPACTTGTNQTLETTGNVGWYTSVAIGNDGNPIISPLDRVGVVTAFVNISKRVRRERHRRTQTNQTNNGHNQPQTTPHNKPHPANQTARSHKVGTNGTRTRRT